MLGTHGYVAPEIYEPDLEMEYEDSDYSKKQDIWALGLIFH